MADDDIHFDHIIPYAKGGSSDEHNIQLLCGTCNLAKGARFERDHLIGDLTHRLSEPAGADIVDFLTFSMDYAHAFKARAGRYPTADDIAEELGEGVTTIAEIRAAQLISDAAELFEGKRPSDIRAKTFRALRARWGFTSGKSMKLQHAAQLAGMDVQDLYLPDVHIVERLGWLVKRDARTRSRWLRS